MVHEKGIVYRDIKPENFVVGRHSMKKNNRIYIIGDTIMYSCNHEDSTDVTAVFVPFDTFFQHHHYVYAAIKTCLKSKISEIIVLCDQSIRKGVPKRFVSILRILKNINVRLVSESDVRYCTLCYLKKLHYFCNFRKTVEQ